MGRINVGGGGYKINLTKKSKTVAYKAVVNGDPVNIPPLDSSKVAGTKKFATKKIAGVEAILSNITSNIDIFKPFAHDANLLLIPYYTVNGFAIQPITIDDVYSFTQHPYQYVVLPGNVNAIKELVLHKVSADKYVATYLNNAYNRMAIAFKLNSDKTITFGTPYTLSGATSIPGQGYSLLGYAPYLDDGTALKMFAYYTLGGDSSTAQGVIITVNDTTLEITVSTTYASITCYGLCSLQKNYKTGKLNLCLFYSLAYELTINFSTPSVTSTVYSTQAITNQRILQWFDDANGANTLKLYQDGSTNAKTFTVGGTVEYAQYQYEYNAGVLEIAEQILIDGERFLMSMHYTLLCIINFCMGYPEFSYSQWRDFNASYISVNAASRAFCVMGKNKIAILSRYSGAAARLNISQFVNVYEGISTQTSAIGNSAQILL